MGEHTFESGMGRVVDLTAAVNEVSLSRLEAIACLDSSGDYLVDGYTSVVAFLVHRCGMGPGEANRQVFMAGPSTPPPTPPNWPRPVACRSASSRSSPTPKPDIRNRSRSTNRPCAKPPKG